MEIHLFRKFGGVGVYRWAEKCLGPENSPESFGPLAPPRKELSIFLIKGKVFAKVRSTQTFFL